MHETLKSGGVVAPHHFRLVLWGGGEAGTWAGAGPCRPQDELPVQTLGPLLTLRHGYDIVYTDRFCRHTERRNEWKTAA